MSDPAPSPFDLDALRAFVAGLRAEARSFVADRAQTVTVADLVAFARDLSAVHLPFVMAEWRKLGISREMLKAVLQHICAPARAPDAATEAAPP